jgi:hypothetical protein
MTALINALPDALTVSAISETRTQLAAEPVNAFFSSSNRHRAVTCQLETRASAHVRSASCQ